MRQLTVLSPEGNVLAPGSWDKTTLVVGCRSRFVDESRSHRRNCDFTSAERQQYVGAVIPYTATCPGHSLDG